MDRLWFRLVPMFTWHGRLTRREFWIGILVVVVAMPMAFGADVAVGRVFAAYVTPHQYPATAIAGWVSVAYFFSISIRRLHDVGYDSWTMSVLLIPYIGIVWYLWRVSETPMEGRNIYGPERFLRFGRQNRQQTT